MRVRLQEQLRIFIKINEVCTGGVEGEWIQSQFALGEKDRI